MTYYRQCVLVKQEYPAISEQVAWIPEQFAVLGKYLRIEDDNGWRVEEVGALQHDESYTYKIMSVISWAIVNGQMYEDELRISGAGSD